MCKRVILLVENLCYSGRSKKSNFHDSSKMLFLSHFASEKDYQVPFIVLEINAGNDYSVFTNAHALIT